MRVGAIGLLGSIAAIAIALAIVSALPAESDRPVVLVLRVLAAAIRGFGIGCSIFFSLLFTAGLFGTIVKEWRLRRLVSVTLLVVATGTFLLLPFCWNPKSDDCRSLAVRARDALSS